MYKRKEKKENSSSYIKWKKETNEKNIRKKGKMVKEM
jgi:hypothetical protein